jgi:hypothetical protein
MLPTIRSLTNFLEIHHLSVLHGVIVGSVFITHHYILNVEEPCDLRNVVFRMYCGP